MTLGNHEFDAGDDVLGEFLQNLTFPIISANIVSSHSILNATIKPFHVFEQYQLAIIGAIAEETPASSSPGEGTKFTDVVEAVQNTINIVKSTRISQELLQLLTLVTKKISSWQRRSLGCS
jgi:2',3'-cyclic-nucleotide 2'-phosphodiesterase (5'-nucleotidase family)